MKLQSLIDLIACILVLMGGLNWGLVGLLDFDLVASIFGKKVPFPELYIQSWGLQHFI